MRETVKSRAVRKGPCEFCGGQVVRLRWSGGTDRKGRQIILTETSCTGPGCHAHDARRSDYLG